MAIWRGACATSTTTISSSSNSSKHTIPLTLITMAMTAVKRYEKQRGGGGDKGGRQLSSWLTDLSTGSFFFSGVLSSDLDGVHFRTALSRTLTADHTATLAAAAAAVALV